MGAFIRSVHMAIPRIILDDVAHGGRARYWAGVFPPGEARDMYEQLDRETPWTTETVVMYGKHCLAKRQSATYGDHEGLRYNYGGTGHGALPWTPTLLKLRDVGDRLAGVKEPSNYAVLNRYKDGQDTIGLHSDKERDLVPGAPILSFSFGEPRDFVLRPNATFRPNDARVIVTTELASGSLLSMEGTLQSHYKHGVPVRKRCTRPRINITFRRVKDVETRVPAAKRGREEDTTRTDTKRAKF